MKKGQKIWSKGCINYKFQYKSNKLLLIKVGAGGSLEGHENKYTIIAENFIKNNFSVLICDNDVNTHTEESFHYTNLIAYELMKQETDEKYEVYYFGISRGASQMLCYGYEYRNIKKAILVNPPITVNLHKNIEGLEKIKNVHIHIIIGSKDPCGIFAKSFSPWENKFIRASIFEGADHNFTGFLDEFTKLPNEFLKENF